LAATLLAASLLFANYLAAHSLEKNQVPFKPKISIVIDDLGDNSIIAKKMLSLPGKLTAAILPNTPHAKLISHFADKQGHDIIMHLPMEAFTRPDLLGPGALFADMDKPTFSYTFDQDAASIPHIIGFNNHMGSLLTENKEKMSWLMDQAKINNLFFLDSKTSENSIAEYIALKEGVPTIARDVFLDHDKQSEALLRQFNLSKLIAKRKGQVVIICHPYPETLAFLQNNIASLGDEFELVGLSELMPTQRREIIGPSVAR
jgi:polysaccharide deacetylase 2 family uncharacterized protein YibQ